MFTREILSTTFTSDIADTLFPNITGGVFRSDRTFISTMRALLQSRLGADERVDLTFVSSGADMSSVTGTTKKAAMEQILMPMCNLKEDTGRLVICSLTNSDENNSASMEFIKNNFKTVYGKDYVKVEDLTVFMKRLADADFYINSKLRNTVIVTSNLNAKTVHMIQCLLPRLFPWYFNDREEPMPVDDMEKQLLCSLGKKSPAEYITLIEEFAKRYDFRTAQIKTKLKGYEKNFEARKLQSIKEEIARYVDKLRAIEASYRETLKEKEARDVVQLGLMQRQKDDEHSELMEYFLCNKTLHLTDATPSRLDFIAETYLDNYDPEMFDRMIENTSSVFYYFTNDRFNKDDVKMLLNAIFGEDAVLKIRTCAAFCIDIDDLNATGRSHYTYPAAFENHLPNQHIHRHSCLGNNEMYILECLSKQDYVLAIEQCVSAARNFNMADATVAEEFMEAIFSPSAKKFIEMPDSKLCTPYEALEWLKKENSKEEI